MCELIISAVSAIGTVAAAVFAAVAACQTRKQIELSNRQSLFDKRIERWIKAEGLLALFEKNRDLIAVGDDPVLEADLLFIWLTNNAWLEDSASALKNIEDTSDKKQLLTRLEEIDALAKEIALLFDGTTGTRLQVFVADYANLLRHFYEYHLITLKLHEDAERFHHTLEEARKSIGELKYHNRLNETISTVEVSYDAFIQSGGRTAIEEQIKIL